MTVARGRVPQSKQVPLPRFAPMPLAVLPQPFDHADWLFENKSDGFRALAYVEHRRVRLVSRKANVYKSFDGTDGVRRNRALLGRAGVPLHGCDQGAQQQFARQQCYSESERKNRANQKGVHASAIIPHVNTNRQYFR
jgi:hypothetical protein